MNKSAKVCDKKSRGVRGDKCKISAVFFFFIIINNGVSKPTKSCRRWKVELNYIGGFPIGFGTCADGKSFFSKFLHSTFSAGTRPCSKHLVQIVRPPFSHLCIIILFYFIFFRSPAPQKQRTLCLCLKVRCLEVKKQGRKEKKNIHKMNLRIVFFFLSTKKFRL